MPLRMQKVLREFDRLSRIEKAFLIALCVQVAYFLLDAMGFPLPARGLVGLAFVIVAIIFVIRRGPQLIQKLLWRVRHRLLVTWVLVGAVPIVLICLLFGEGLFILMGQVVSYMTTNEVGRRSELIRNRADALAWSLSHRDSSATIPALTETFLRQPPATSGAKLGAVVRTGGEVFVLPQD